MSEMKTLTIGGTTFEIVDDKARKNIELASLKGNASGNDAVVIDDVSPVPHAMGVRVWSKNIVHIPYTDESRVDKLTVGSTLYETTMTINEDNSITVTGTPTKAASFRICDSIDATPFRGKAVAIPYTGTTVYWYVHVRDIDGVATWTWLTSNKSNTLTKIVPENAKTFEIGVVALTSFSGEAVTMYPQINVDTVAGDYTPFVDIGAVKVRTYGRNLLNVANAKMIATKLSSQLKKERTKTGLKIVGANSIGAGYHRAGFCLGLSAEMRGRTFTLSYGNYTNTTTNAAPQIGIVVYRDDDRQQSYIDDGYVGNSDYFISLADVVDRKYITFTIPPDIDVVKYPYIGVMFSITRGQAVAVGDTAEYSNIILEAKDCAGKYEAYISPAEYAVDTDGTVEGVTPIHPTTTLITDTPSVAIGAGYQRDLTKAFDEIINAIISLGGNV